MVDLQHRARQWANEGEIPTHALLAWLPCKTLTVTACSLTSFGVVELEDEGSSGYNAGTSWKKIPEEEDKKSSPNSPMTDAGMKAQK